MGELTFFLLTFGRNHEMTSCFLLEASRVATQTNADCIDLARRVAIIAQSDAPMTVAECRDASAVGDAVEPGGEIGWFERPSLALASKESF